MSSVRGRMALTFLFLFAVWLMWSGYLKPLLVVLGLLSCGLVTILCARMDLFRNPDPWLKVIPRLPGFWLWLLKEVVTSNLRVARIVLSRDPARLISPTVVTVRALPPDELGQATLGNCITLTPGTVTLDDHEGELLVHCLTRSEADGLVEGEMNRRVEALTRA